MCFSLHNVQLNNVNFNLYRRTSEASGKGMCHNAIISIKGRKREVGIKLEYR